MPYQKISLRTIAKIAKVDHTTVCKVLNKTPNYKASKETKRKIFQVARRLKYNFLELYKKHKRRWERIDVGVPVRVEIRLKKSNKLWDRGKAKIYNISGGGALIGDIKLSKKQSIPLDSHIIKIEFIDRQKGDKLIGQPIRIESNGRLGFGIEWREISQRERLKLMKMRSNN